MLRAGVDGLAEGADGAGLPAPLALAVTILTSDDGAPPAHPAQARGAPPSRPAAAGIVCAAADVREAKPVRARGCSPVGAGHPPRGCRPHDQARAATPAEALDGGRRPARGRAGRDRRRRPGPRPPPTLADSIVPSS